MKTKEQILNDLKRVTAESVEIDPETISLTASLRNDLGIDSLDSIDIITSIEDVIGVTLTDKETAKIDTVNDLVEALFAAQSRIAKAA